jgi:hypothetical protein
MCHYATFAMLKPCRTGYLATRAHAVNRSSTTIQVAYAAPVHCIVNRQQIHTFHAVVTKCTIIEINCVVTAAVTNEAAGVHANSSTFR